MPWEVVIVVLPGLSQGLGLVASVVSSGSDLRISIFLGSGPRKTPGSETAILGYNYIVPRIEVKYMYRNFIPFWAQILKHTPDIHFDARLYARIW